MTPVYLLLKSFVCNKGDRSINFATKKSILVTPEGSEDSIISMLAA